MWALRLSMLCIYVFVLLGCDAREQGAQVCIFTLYHPKGRFTHSIPCPCRVHAVPLPCRAAKDLDCVFPIWITQCGRVWFTLAMPCPCRANALLRPRRSSQGHGTACPSRDGLWATCPLSASSGYNAEFHEDYYQKHTNPPHNDP